MIIMVFLVVFWAVQFGAGKVERMMESSPRYIQQYVVGTMSILGTYDGNVSTKIYPADIEFAIKNTQQKVAVVSDRTQYATDVERGGSVSYADTDYLPFVTVSGVEIQERENKFRPALDTKYVEIAKIGDVIGIGVGK